MNRLILKIYVLYAFLMISDGIHAQCSVNKEFIPEDNITIYRFEPEMIYSYEDIDNQRFIDVALMFMLIDRKIAQGMVMGLGVTFIGYKPPILPREVVLYSSGETLNLRASRYEKKLHNDSDLKYAYWFYYDIDLEDYSFIIQNPIDKIMIFDNRINKSKSFSIYHEILSNQAYCVYGKWKSEQTN